MELSAFERGMIIVACTATTVASTMFIFIAYRVYTGLVALQHNLQPLIDIAGK